MIDLQNYSATTDSNLLLRQSFNNQIQEAQLQCAGLRQKSVKVIDRTYNKWFSIEILLEQFKLLFSC